MNDEGFGRQAAALVEAGIALASELDIDSLLQRIADLSREVLRARYGAVGVVRDDGMLERFVFSGIDQETADRIGPLPEGRGVLGVLIEEGRPLRLHRISDHPRSYGFPHNHPPMNSFLGVPIVVRGHVYGRLYLTEKEGGGDFSKDDERLAMTLAAQAGVAIQNANLLDEVRSRGEALAILEERERISKELHDGVIQSIYSVGLSLQGALSLLERDPAMAGKRIDAAVGELDNVVRDVRSYIFALRPKMVEEQGLAAAIAELAKDLEVNTLATATVELHDGACHDVPAAVQTDVVQIVREVLSNIARHAQASEVGIVCSRSDGALRLEITDNGRGYDPATVPRGHGLTNIEDRARRIRGSLEIAPREPSGMRHVLTLPREEAGSNA
ncbi:MAG TPA: GAF domain-containing sensor histidine kinase [Actinomycetota bacterium]|nr:GAF domain-containing sensor histidine kinase [Actinomycetota bacterium]